MADRVRYGVISTADIALKKVIPAIQASSMSRVDAIASRDGSRARSAASEHGIARGYGSYEELLADDDIEAVYIPLPNHLHLEWAVAAAEAGKHVLCEKPLAMTAGEARRMIETCAASGVLLMEAFMYRLHPLWMEALRLIRSGSIGEPAVVDTVFTYFNDDPTNIRNIPEAGGGALYDIGCYAINASRMIFDSEPTALAASIRRDDQMGVDVVTAASMRFGERLATFLCSTRLEPDQRVVVYGTEGRLVIPIPFNIPPDQPTRLELISGGEPPVSPAVTVHEIPKADQYGVQADGFSRAIREGTPVPIPPQDAVANLEVIERIFAAAVG